MQYTEQAAKSILQQEKNLKLQSNLPGLRQVRPFYYGLKESPIDIKQASPAGVVFFNLQVCYSNQKNISEGSIEDVIWGFRQSGLPNNITWQGFLDLHKLGYIRFTNSVGVSLLGTPSEKMWYQWTDKYYSILLLSPEVENDLQIEDKIKGKDTTVEKVGA